jgi:hypothetical protein
MLFCEKSVEKIQVSLKCDKNHWYFTWGQMYIFYRIWLFLLRMENVSGRNCRENQNKRSLFNNFFFENRTVCTIMWKNFVRPARPQMTIWRIRVAFWKPKATNTRSEYVIFIALPRQKVVSRKHLSVRLIRELLSHYCLALSQRRFANVPLSFVMFFRLYAHNRLITTERIVIKFHNTGGFYEDNCGRIIILVKIGRNDSRKLQTVLLASLA